MEGEAQKIPKKCFRTVDAASNIKQCAHRDRKLSGERKALNRMRHTKHKKKERKTMQARGIKN